MYDRTDDTLLHYEWDPAKAKANRAKHDVAFVDAIAVLESEHSVTAANDVVGEYRRASIGLDALGRTLTVHLDLARRARSDHLRSTSHGKRAGSHEVEAMKDEYDFSKGKRGAIFPPGPGKTKITIRIDDEILDWFRDAADAAGGGSYQTMVNGALRDYIRGVDIEAKLRRVLREELRRTPGDESASA